MNNTSEEYSFITDVTVVGEYEIQRNRKFLLRHKLLCMNTKLHLPQGFLWWKPIVGRHHINVR
jgi:hypothetical protein